MNLFVGGFDFLTAQTFPSLLSLFWFVFVFEIPRYFLSFLLILLVKRPAPVNPQHRPEDHRLSVVIAGHSEAGAVERAVAGMHEQSLPPDEIILVSDGSTDEMPAKLASLLKRGLITQAHSTELRAGKSAGTNMASRWATGDIIVNIDCDCSFDRHALRNLLRPFEDPDVVAVCGNIQVRNRTATLVTSFQAIEYLIAISLGKQASAKLNQVTCVSGAFGAFRKVDYDAAGGLDAGGGEDLDLTLRLRRAGGKIAFAEDAICYTDVPATTKALIQQRFRWERDAVRLRYRKHVDLMNPFSKTFKTSELIHELDFLFFNIVSAAVLPFYIIWLFVAYGDFGFTVLASAQIGLFVLDLSTFLIAAYATPKTHSYKLLVYLPGYSLFNGVYMRLVRLAAYIQEWVFRASYQDTYVPDKVHQVRG